MSFVHEYKNIFCICELFIHFAILGFYEVESIAGKVIVVGVPQLYHTGANCLFIFLAYGDYLAFLFDMDNIRVVISGEWVAFFKAVYCHRWMDIAD